MRLDISALLADYRAGKLSSGDVRDQLRRLGGSALTCPLSESQKGLWVLQKTYPGMSAYNVPMYLRVDDLDLRVFRAACEALAQKYPILSCTIDPAGDVPHQSVDLRGALDFDVVDMAAEGDEHVLAVARAEAKRPFTLDGERLFRVRVFTRAGRSATILITVHHIIFDGSSAVLLLDALFEIYAALVSGRRPDITPLAPSFFDFVREEQRDAPSRREAVLDYWKRKLKPQTPALQLPTLRPRAAVRDRYAGTTYVQVVAPALVQKLRELSAAEHSYLSSTLLALFASTLATFTEDRELWIGVPVNERRKRALSKAIGLMVNVVPLQLRLDDEEISFSQLLSATQRELIDAMLYSYPLPALVRELSVARHPDRAPIFQAAFVYQDVLQGLGGLGAAQRGYAFIDEVHQEGEFELSMEVWDQSDRFALHWKYNPELYARETIEAMARRFIELASRVSTGSVATLRELRRWYACEATEREGVAAESQDPAAWPCVHEMFEEQARRTPDAIAVSSRGARLTYRELSERSDALAAYLHVRGVQRSDLVALCVERSAELVVALLGILKAGAAYVPLDPEFPRERLAAILADSRASALITESRLKESVLSLLAVPDDAASAPAPTLVTLDQEGPEIARARALARQLPEPVASSDLIYVIFTSGSTGTPKGVMIQHGGFTNLMRSMSREPGIGPSDTLFAVTTVSFDMAQLELLLPLVCGAHCHVCDGPTIKDVEALKERIQSVRPTIMQATPALWNMLFHAGWTNQEGLRVFCGGEALSRALKERFLATGSEAWNLYGPTETTVYSTAAQVTRERPITIGKPLDNTHVYIVDEQLRVVPPGETGELCIAGVGVARGYLNRPELTAEKFVDSPFRAGEKLYRTGDVARWTADGEIEYLGRRDFQVKIRGYRVELGDIEYHLGRHERVKECVVVARGEEGARQLVAYYVPTRDGEAGAQDAQAFRAALREQLPSYMVPDLFVAIDRIPLTGSGKVDRNALMARGIVLAPRRSAPPLQAALEAEVSRCWSEVLQVHDIDPGAPFFEVGGNSLTAILLAKRISKQFQVPFVASDLFKHVSVREIAAFVCQQQLGHHASLAESAAAAQGGPRPQPRASEVGDALAVVGIACHFPGARSPREFWTNLTNGRESATLWTEPELRDAAIPEHVVRASGYVPVRFAIEGKELFDGEFFKLSPNHVSMMDPQFRQLLMHAWKAVEDAGYDHREIANTGVYVASGNHFYGAPEEASAPAAVLEDPQQYMAWVMSQTGTVASMIAYQMGFTGPSLSVHSNCSSSLSALALACQSLRSGEIEFALVAAASATSFERAGYVYQPGLNFASDGHVKAFDARADGMVSGEGVAALLLRRASDAIADGDPIYGLIRGIAINSDGGDASGFYSPSVKGQSRVIQRALEQSGLEARSIGYVEAHGTGTKLGDPVEVQALTEAYRRHTPDVGFCGLGSVKPNIGHLDTAAGLAGCLKVLLSLKHRKLPPSINFESPNPELRLAESPFYVVDHLRDWPAGAHPRRAALNSIGLGGTNAHAIFEEYACHGSADLAEPSRSAYLVPLSAREESNLKEYATSLLEHLTYTRVAGESGGEPLRLRDVAYTLQVGRVPMASRVAFVVRDLDELCGELEHFVAGQVSGRIHVGSVSRECGLGAADAARIPRWIEKGKLKKLAKAWVSGAQFDWEGLSPRASCRRLNLPAYPFSRVRYPWAARLEGKATRARAATLHPLLQQDLSRSGESRYRSRFTGGEFFVRDHVVRGRPLLPAVAGLEMVHAALRRAQPEAAASNACVSFKGVNWLRPVPVGQAGQAVEVSLSADGAPDEQARKFRFEVRFDGGAEAQVHMQGRVVIGPAAARPQIDLAALGARMRLERLEGDACYARIAEAGVAYGPAFRLLRAVRRGEGQGSGEVLAELALPEALGDSFASYVLHPSIMDAAIQASLGLEDRWDEGERARSVGASHGDRSATRVPFALERLDVFGTFHSEMFAWVRPAPDRRAQPSGPRGDTRGQGVGPGRDQAREPARALDIDLVDAAGRVCASFRGLSFRLLEERIGAGAGDRASVLHTLLPVWRAVAPVVQGGAGEPRSPHEQELVIFGADGKLQAELAALRPGSQFHVLSSSDSVEQIQARLTGLRLGHLLWVAPRRSEAADDLSDVVASQQQGVIQVFRIAKALINLGWGARALSWTLLTFGTQRLPGDETVDPRHAGVHGLMGSLAKEYVRWQVAVLDLPLQGELRAQDLFFPRAREASWTTLALRQGRWFSQELVPTAALSAGEPPYKRNGVYVIVGGAGGIGELWSRFMVQTYQASIVWIGRRAPNAEIEAKLRELSELAGMHGARAPIYLSADARDPAALRAAHAEIKRLYPHVDGLVHSAIVLADSSFAKMDEATLRAALDAKVDVSVNLSQVFGQEPLDFVLFFSSVESFVRAAGQANYAAGCTFKDAFAQALASAWRARPGRPAVKTIHWGYWGIAGVVSDAFYRERMAALGVASLEPRSAFHNLSRFLGSDFQQVTLLQTLDAKALRGVALDGYTHVGASSGSSAMGAVKAVPPVPASELERLRGFLPHPRMHALAHQLLFVTLRELGLSRLSERVLPKYHRWLEESERLLAEFGLLGSNGRGRVDLGRVQLRTEALWEQWRGERSQWCENANSRAQVGLLESCLASLGGVLTGARQATELLFPNSSMDKVEGVYRDEPVAAFFNHELSRMLVAAVRHWVCERPTRRLRILEVGAGTGATASQVLQALEPFRDHIEEYRYTDVSKAFLFRAEELLAPKHPFLRTGIFNVEHAAEGQGMAAGHFDLVVATNVLHATRDVRRVLRNVKTTLRANGLLFVNEMSKNTIFAHLTFGLLDGWWLSEDAALRIPGSPVLAPRRWLEALADEGFVQAHQPDLAADVLGQQVTVAESDGVLREDAQQRPAVRELGSTAVGRPGVRPPPEGGSEAQLREHTARYFEELLRRTLRLSEPIDRQRDIHEYGLDSILVASMNNALAADFEDVESTIFFELRTIDALVDHFVATRRPALSRLFELGEVSAAGQSEALAPLAELGAYLRELAAAVLKLPVEQLDAERDLFDYGLDSILVVQLNNMLAKDFSDLGSTLIFELRTADALARYLLAEQASAARAVVARRRGANTPAASSLASVRERPTPAQPRQRGRPQASEHARDGEIAIVGLSGRYPSAESTEEFWDNLSAGRSCTAAYPAERWWCDWRGRNRPWGGFLRDVGCFDADFFGISSADAELMDPQERVFIETTYAAIQDAGYTPKTLSVRRRVGVFVGVMNSSYLGRAAHSSIANRTSYLFDFQGPSVAVDTACSSSLTAIHMAVESLKAGDSDWAIAGGVNLLLEPHHFDDLAELNVLSTGRQCRPFSEHADGFLASEGVGVLVLRPLDLAIAAGDQIYAVIKASALNAGGRTNKYNVPNLHAQRDVVARALEKAGLEAGTISYVEAHGTATQLGDSIEVSALTRAFQEAGSAGAQHCAIGSVKSNIGHCESAAGIAGLTKILMQLRHRQLAPSIHAEELNAGIVFKRSPFFVQRELSPWTAPEQNGQPAPRRAGISCFGAGGSNAHLIVEEYLAAGAEDAAAFESAAQLVPLSARSVERLGAVVRALYDFLSRAEHGFTLRELAYTLQVGREHLPARAMFVVRSLAELKAALRDFAPDGTLDAAVADAASRQGAASEEEILGYIARSDLQALGRHWLQGGTLAWEALHAAPLPRRISLPTYPFERTFYWSRRAARFAADAPDAALAGGAVEARPERHGQRPALGAERAEPGTESARTRLIQLLARHANLPPSELRGDRHALDLGLSSMALVQLARAIKVDIDPTFEPARFFEQSSIDELAASLVQGVESSPAGPAASLSTSTTPQRGGDAATTADLRVPLSQGQRGIWALQKMAPRASVYNVPLAVRVERLDIEAFRRAVRLIVSRHPLLACAIAQEQGSLAFVPAASGAQVLVERSLSPMEWRDSSSLLRHHAKFPFALERGPLCRVELFRGPGDHALALVNVHHIVLDGASAVLLLKELHAAYESFRADRAPTLPPRGLDYHAFVAAEAASLQSQEAEARLAYWRAKLAAPLPVVALHPDRPRDASQGQRGATVIERISLETSRQVRRFAAEHRVFPSSTFIALLALLLRRHTQQDDILLGMAVNGRSDAFQGTVGHFVNMVPVRNRIAGGMTFAALCGAVQKEAITGIANDYPFAALVRELGLSSGGRSPVFSVAFMYQDWHEDLAVVAPSFEYVEGIHQEGEYELVLEVIEPAREERGFALHWRYDPDVFDGDTVRNIARQYRHLLETALTAPLAQVDEHTLVSPDDRHTMLSVWNDTGVAYARTRMSSLFEEQAARTPDALAVACGDACLTYAELEQRSTQLAIYLQSQGIGPNDLAAVYMERSVELVVALLGVMKAGGAYVPLDPGYPKERLAYILEDSAVRVVLSQASLRRELTELDLTTDDAGAARQLVLLDERWPEIEQVAATRARSGRAPGGDDLAYVIYTSGSTGHPKGVMVPHAALANFLCSMAKRPGLHATDRVLAVTTHSFDIAALELYLPLIAGAQCHVCSAAEARDGDRLKALIARVRPTVMQATPSTWTMLLHAGWTNPEKTRLLCGGEALPDALKEALLRTGSELWNLFGPTETTVWSTIEKVEVGKPISIGRPIDNTQVYVLDVHGRLAPMGAPGELCIAGDGLAKGYLNKPELTAERFVANPFQANARMYRTGDLARWRNDGSLQYLGRIDSQVKINGFRIETGEVEHAVASHARVRECVVVARTSGESKQLVAYYTVDGHAQVERDLGAEREELRAYLRRRLPEYMVPAFLVRLAEIPRTPNGKADRKALAERALAPAAPLASARESTPHEADVLAIFRDVLQVSHVQATDAFLDAGGNSVLAAVLADRLSTRFGVTFTAAEVFKCGNARATAAHLAGTRRESEGAPTPRTSGARPASELQDGLAQPAYYEDCIAIIGISCSVPGAENHRQFWRDLVAGKEGIKIHSTEELAASGVGPSLREDPHFVPASATIADKGCFDAEFFQISARDAEIMDPQLRLLLQHSWKAIEDAGYLPRELADAAVFVSTCNSLYQAPLALRGPQQGSAALVNFLLSQPGTIPTTISHKLGLKGPSLFVHSNCSSSLAGLGLAFQSIQSKQTSCALVGAATVFSERSPGYLYEEGMTLSRDGRCRPFDADANGMVGGEGVVVVLLKDARSAIRDGDHVYALLRGVGMNNDGADKAGYYAPSVAGQAEVIRTTLVRAGVAPETIRYVEAHGTGTALGDPIEVMALSEAYGQGSERAGSCSIGSVKSNIGHLDAAAGLAGCVKAALALSHRAIPPTVHFRRANPQIHFADSPFTVADRLIDLSPAPRPLRAAVSSFGIGGTNVHAILEEGPRDAGASCASGEPQIVPLSARGRENLERYARELAEELEAMALSDTGAPALADVAFTLQVGRTAMPIRVAFVVRTTVELVGCLREFAAGRATAAYFGRAAAPAAGAGPTSVEENHAALISRWVEQGALEQLARSWSAGHAVDWRGLHRAGERPRRISLPTYPFTRDYHWLPTPSADPLPEPPRIELSPQVFEERWVKMAASARAVGEAREPLEAVSVCLLSDPRDQAALERALAELAPRTKLVFLSQRTDGEATRDVFHVERSDPESLDRALSAVARQYGAIDALYDFWPVEDKRCLGDVAYVAELLKSLVRAGLVVKDVLLVRVFEDADEQALCDALVAFERSAGRVLPEICLRVVMHAGAVSIERWAALLHTERRQVRKESVMYRADGRHVSRVEPILLPEQAGRGALRQRGTYLITGGARGLGRQLSEYLAATYSANLILLGRSALRQADTDWLSGLARRGGSAHYREVDVSDEAALRRCLAGLPPELREIHGLIHAAGTAEPMSVLDKTRSGFEAVLSAKLRGTQALERALGEHALDFICYFSSTAATLGDFGSCDYAVANRFLAARARAYADGERPGTKRIAIGWPLWEAGGMGAAAQRQAQREFVDSYLESSGQQPLSTALGLSLFERLLVHPRANPFVLVAEPRRAREMLAGLELPSAPQESEEASVGADRRGVRGGARERLRGSLASDVRALLAQVLKAAPGKLDAQANFSELGLDSIRLTEFSQRLSQRLAVKLVPTVFYDHPSLARLVEFLLDEHGDRLEHSAVPSSAAEPVTTQPVARAVAQAPDRSEPGALAARGPRRDQEAIAIVGMSGTFPGCRSLSDFWSLLLEGRSAISELPAWRFPPDALSEAALAPEHRWMASIDWVDEFDPAFFEISPKEAHSIDPRQRHLLQEAWKALEDAGLGPEAMSGRRVGMFVGVEQGDYQLLVKEGGNLTSNHDGILAARLSYFMDFKGPVLAINTSCSSGLVALHQACASLRNGECDVAIVGAANFILTAGSLAAMGRAGMLASTAKCRVFDDRADGMVPGEAVVALVLRRRADAEADGDPIHSLIVATGINYDGKTNGITAPSGEAQRDLIESIYRAHGIAGGDIDYIVTHGTGTKLGDPVEINALNTALGTRAGKAAFCALTSTKANVGHAFAASGLVSLIGLSQSLRHRIIPPAVHCEVENRYVEWEKGACYVNKTAKPWAAQPGKPRMGGVSAFGMSGTNAHVVLQEYVAPPPVQGGRRPHYMLPLSAKTAPALAQRVEQMLEVLARGELQDADLARLSETLFTGRHHFRHRCAIVVQDLQDALEKWRGFARGTAQEQACFAGVVPREFVADPAEEERIRGMLKRATESGGGNEREHHRTMCALAALYVQGYPIPWCTTLVEGRRSSRLRLPTYPFASNRFWTRGTARDSQAPTREAEAQRPGPGAERYPNKIALANPAQPALEPVKLSKPTPVALKPLASADGNGKKTRLVIERDVLEDLKSAANLDFAGMVPTLNRTGVMVEHLIPYSEDFVEYAGHCAGEVLDLGCAYGVASIEALSRGARVVALDMERKHLEILAQRVDDAARARLTLKQGTLPDVDFEDGRFSAIHASRVLHFLGPDDVRTTLRKMYRWLAPGGRIFLTSDSPYFGYWASTADQYHARKQAGDEWPGYIEGVHEHFAAADVAGGPSRINPLDPDVFSRECTAAGFLVEKTGFFGSVGVSRRASNAPQADMEHVGVIARKPDAAQPRPQLRSSLRSADGCEVHYSVAGSGKVALVFIHGLGCESAFWDEQVRFFSREFTVLTLDLAGHGRSGGGRSRWTVEAFARDVAAVVDAVGAKDVFLIGHSLGGPVALETAPLVRANVLGLIGVDTLHNLEPRPMTRQKIEGYVNAHAEHPVSGAEMFLDRSRSELIELVDRSRARVGAEVISAAFGEMLSYLQAMPKAFHAPVVLINSSAWMPTNFDACRKYSVAVELMDEVGHFLMLERPDELNAQIRKWIDRMRTKVTVCVNEASA